MKKIKLPLNNCFEKEKNLNKNQEQINISHEQKALSKLAFNQLPLKTFIADINACKNISELTAYKISIKQKFDTLYKKEKAWIKPLDIKSIEYLSGLHQETKDRLLESNLFHLIVQKLTIDYLKNSSNKKENYNLEEFNKYKNEIASVYKLKLQLTLKETLISYNDLLLEYLFNESDQLTVSEFLQQIAVVNEHSIGLKYYVKTTKGTGDCYAQRNESNDYIEVELKSGDLETESLIKLLFKIQDNYLHLKEILFFIDGDKELILDIIDKNNIIIPKNIDLKFINTKEIFPDNNYKYYIPKSKDIAFKEIYKSLNRYGFKKEIDRLFEQSVTKENVDITKYENLLKENYSLEWVEICQEIGETFLDLNKPSLILDNNEYSIYEN